MKNKKINKISILFLLVIMLPLTYAIQNYYEIDLYYDNGNISMKNIQITPFVMEQMYGDQSGGYHAQVVNFNYEIIDITFFDIPLVLFWDSWNENGDKSAGGIIKLNQTDFKIYIPYYENANLILLYNYDIEEIFRIDVTTVSKNKSVEQPTGVIGEADAEEKLSEILERQRKTERKIDILSYIGLFIVLMVLFVITIHELKKRKHV
ncbi:hypothetical protein ACFL1H_03950 [Nanoarchaeota archaeon]